MTTGTETVSLDDAKRHLNVTTSEDDGLILDQIEAAKTYLSRWVGQISTERSEVPADVRQAVLMLVAHWYENREASLVGINAQELPMGVQSIIDAHREWAF